MSETVVYTEDSHQLADELSPAELPVSLQVPAFAPAPRTVPVLLFPDDIQSCRRASECSASAIRVENVWKKYGKEENHVLRNFNMTVPKGTM